MHAHKSPPFDDAYLVNVLKEAKEFYEKNSVDDKYIEPALNLIRAYYLIATEPREPYPFYASILYIISRHPWTYPNPFTKIEFISRFNVKESSFDWYVKTICESLNIIVLHDLQHFPYFIPPDDVSYCIINTRISYNISISKIQNALEPLKSRSTSIIADEIVDELTNKLSIIPSSLQTDLYQFIERCLKKRLNEKLIEL